jgi:Zinc knuckle
LICYFCGKEGHIERDCLTKQKASAEAKKQTGKPGQGRNWKRKQNAKEASQDAESAPPAQAGNMAHVEFAGNASALPASHRAAWQQSWACTDWNTDTGATSHMTPHKH